MTTTAYSPTVLTKDTFSVLANDRGGVDGYMMMDVGIYDMETTPIPPDLEHRILDGLTANADLMGPKSMAVLHKTHHFALGVEASQSLLLLTAEPDWLASMAEFAPAPFEEYSFSMFMGARDRIVEAMVLAHTEPNGEQYLEGYFLPWGETHLANPAKRGQGSFHRSTLNEDGIPEDQKLTILLDQAFRLILAIPGRTVINQGPPGRTALRRGKRVHFYSKSEVTIRLDAPPREHVVEHTGHGKMMPVYQYRAHLCHSGGTKGCDHTFERDYERANPYWVCSKCGRRRWHRKAGTRGSAEIGYVRQTYRVLKGEDK